MAKLGKVERRYKKAFRAFKLGLAKAKNEMNRYESLKSLTVQLVCLQARCTFLESLSKYNPGVDSYISEGNPPTDSGPNGTAHQNGKASPEEIKYHK